MWFQSSLWCPYVPVGQYWLKQIYIVEKHSSSSTYGTTHSRKDDTWATCAHGLCTVKTTKRRATEMMHACTANLKPAETDQWNQIYSPWEMGTELCCLWRLWAHRLRVPPQHDQAAGAWSWSWIFSCGPLLPRTHRKRRSEIFWWQVKEKCQGKQTFTFHLKVDEKSSNHIPWWNFVCVCT